MNIPSRSFGFQKEKATPNGIVLATESFLASTILPSQFQIPTPV